MKRAFRVTCKKRGTEYLEDDGLSIIQTINSDVILRNLWSAYQKKFSYARDLQYDVVVGSTMLLFSKTN